MNLSGREQEGRVWRFLRDFESSYRGNVMNQTVYTESDVVWGSVLAKLDTYLLFFPIVSETRQSEWCEDD
jgi:hypothetical protein